MVICFIIRMALIIAFSNRDCKSYTHLKTGHGEHRDGKKRKSFSRWGRVISSVFSLAETAQDVLPWIPTWEGNTFPVILWQQKGPWERLPSGEEMPVTISTTSPPPSFHGAQTICAGSGPSKIFCRPGAALRNHHTHSALLHGSCPARHRP